MKFYEAEKSLSSMNNMVTILQRSTVVTTYTIWYMAYYENSDICSPIS